MELTNLIKDKKEEITGSLSLSRMTALGTFAVLSAGFILNAYRKAVTWEVYVAYPLGVSIAFAPQLFLRLLNGIKDVIAVWKGNQSNE
jgi:hypothetical protein